jgi:hypothetical protein
LKEKAVNDKESDWFVLKYIPRRTYENVQKKWLDDEQRTARETHFDFLDYREIIKWNIDLVLTSTFMIGDKGFEWMLKCNVLRGIQHILKIHHPRKRKLNIF